MKLTLEKQGVGGRGVIADGTDTPTSVQGDELERAYRRATTAGQHVRGIAIINPGNPTGNTLTETNIRDILAFAADKQLMVLADEVYQDNIWTSKAPWVSFKKVACDMGLIDPDRPTTLLPRGVQLASFHSTSKGFIGECGRRGGYMELMGFSEGVRAELYKLASISLCSNIGGQLMMGLMTNPPTPGDYSYATYAQERDGILASLRARAVRLVDALQGCEGVTCESPEGALYVFPRIRLPVKAIEAAAAAGKGGAPDLWYCLQLLDATGIVVVPGSGFGQVPGTFHFRSTILPPPEEMEDVIGRFTAFHTRFMETYRDANRPVNDRE